MTANHNTFVGQGFGIYAEIPDISGDFDVTNNLFAVDEVGVGAAPPVDLELQVNADCSGGACDGFRAAYNRWSLADASGVIGPAGWSPTDSLLGETGFPESGYQCEMPFLLPPQSPLKGLADGGIDPGWDPPPDRDFDGFTDGDGDCDDLNDQVFPGATESPVDGIDQNCDGWEFCFGGPDTDGDGFGTELVDLAFADACPAEDCDPDDGDIHPGATETVGNDDDENCDGMLKCFYDADGDGTPGGQYAVIPWSDTGCDQQIDGVQYGSDGEDCNDADPAIGPNAPEIVNDVDDNCDKEFACWKDEDGDGFGSDELVFGDGPCANEPHAAVDSGDCNDNDGSWLPIGEDDADTLEIDADTNCDGFRWCYVDGDDDGVGVGEPEHLEIPGWCVETSGHSGRNDDCDDANSLISPEVAEYGTPDTEIGIDENCDGFRFCHADLDEDSYGGQASHIATGDVECEDYENDVLWTRTDGDCDDLDDTVSPGASPEAPEMWNFDQDCDGDRNCFQDADGDGEPGELVRDVPTDGQACSDVQGYGNESRDCDETDPTVSMSAAELPGNSIDENCDLHLGCYVDNDGDGFGGDTVTQQPCENGVCDDAVCATPHTAANSDDCEDNNSTIYPGAEEIPNDGVLQNCDGEETTIWFGSVGCSNTGFNGGWLGLLVASLWRRNRKVT